MTIWKTLEDQYLPGFSKTLNCKTPPVHIICLYTTLTATENLCITGKENFLLLFKLRKIQLAQAAGWRLFKPLVIIES